MRFDACLVLAIDRFEIQSRLDCFTLVKPLNDEKGPAET